MLKLASHVMEKVVVCAEIQDLKNAFFAMGVVGISIESFFYWVLEFCEDVFEDVLVAHEMEAVFGVIQLLICFGGIEQV